MHPNVGRADSLIDDRDCHKLIVRRQSHLVIAGTIAYLSNLSTRSIDPHQTAIRVHRCASKNAVSGNREFGPTGFVKKPQAGGGGKRVARFYNGLFLKRV